MREGLWFAAMLLWMGFWASVLVFDPIPENMWLYLLVFAAYGYETSLLAKLFKEDTTK